MEFNYLLIAFAIILIACIIRGARKGMLRIVFGMIAWIFLIIFVNYASDFASDYISLNTDIPGVVQENINTHLQDKYKQSEEEEAGSGEDAVLMSVPATIRNEVMESVQTSIDATINAIAVELTDAAIHGIGTIIAVIIGVVVIVIIDKLIKLIGYVPGINDVNRLLGIIAGFAEGILIIWLILYIAKCFPASAFGDFVLKNTENDQMLLFIYQNNIIEKIIGI